MGRVVQAEGRVSVKALRQEQGSFPQPKSGTFQIISWQQVEGG